jgi:GT2 family glycosyltransferase
MENRMTIAVVIASKNRPQNIRAALASIEAQGYAPSEVIVVDQSDTKYALEEYADVRHIYDPALSGLTAARNRGISELHSDCVLFIDDDVALRPDTLSALESAFASYPDAVGFQCDDLEQHDEGRLTGLLNAAFELGFFSRSRQRRGNVIETTWLGGFAMAYRSSVFAFERFDEHLTGYSFGEDWDFSKRAARHGRLLVAQGAEVHHYHSPVNRAGNKSLCKMRWQNYRYFFVKHGAGKSFLSRVQLAWWSLGETYRWLRAGLGVPSDRKAAAKS